MAAVPCSPASPIAWTRGDLSRSSLVAAAALAGFALLVVGVKSAAALQLAAGAGIAGTYMPGLRALTDNVEGTRAQSRSVAFYTAVFGFGTSLSILLSAASPTRWGGPGVRADLSGPGRRRVDGRVRPSAKNARAQARAARARFRPVLASREVRPYIFAMRCIAGVFGSRSWLVAFIVFARVCRSRDHVAGVSAVTIAAVANLFGPAASIYGKRAGDAPRPRAPHLEGDARLGRSHLRARVRVVPTAACTRRAHHAPHVLHHGRLLALTAAS